jgi:putative SOS response-associated peptidase YedK
MCFTVNVNLVKEELENRYGATLIDPDKYRPSYYYHAFALPELPAICSKSPDKITLLKWGLIPSWTKNADDANVIRFRTFNARSETIDTKPAFRQSFKSKRCIIPIRGFFEWQHNGKEKIPWYIYPGNNEIMSLAGLFDEWISSTTGEVVSTFTILTTDANSMMAEIHNSARRMPAVLNTSSENTWIDQSVNQTDLLGLLKPAQDGFLKAHKIGPLVNDRNQNRNTPEVIRPYIHTPENLLF